MNNNNKKLNLIDFNYRDFEARRQKLVNSMPENSCFLIISGSIKYRNHDIQYKFRQDSDFYYLTGLKHEADSVLLIKKFNNNYEEILFIREKTEAEKVWDGIKSNIQDIKKTCEIKNIFYFSALEESLEKNLKNINILYFDYLSSENLLLRRKILDIAQRTRIQEIINSRNILGELRILKEPKELDFMRKSAEINIQAHKLAMKKARPDIFEYELQAELEYFFFKNNADWAYNSIIASGKNSVILHYTCNNKKLKNKELVLIDAGCEFNFYASDITRTFPVSGKFSSLQKELYEIVLKAQTGAINKIKEKNIKFSDIQEASDIELIRGLISLNILKVSEQEALEKNLHKIYSVHSIGHWLGLDTHDSGLYKIQDKNNYKNFNSRIIQENMVMTVEPGLYFSDKISLPESYKELKNTGIRIEDNIIKLENNKLEILTEELPREIKALEKFLNS